MKHRGALLVRVDDGFHHNLEIAAPAFVREWAPRFERRLVFGLASLRDKLLCADHGLDDRALEALKWLVLRESAPTAIQPDSEVYLDEVTPEQLVFSVEAPPGRDRTVVTRRIGVARTRLAEAAAFVPALLLDGQVVDWRAALNPDVPLVDPVGKPRARTPWMPP